jgi:hypothetical protein
MLREIRPAILVLGSNDNEAPGSDGNGGNVATWQRQRAMIRGGTDAAT